MNSADTVKQENIETTEKKKSTTRNFSGYLKDFGAFFYSDGDMSSAIKSLLLSYSISGNKEILFNLIDLFNETKMFEHALDLANSFHKKHPDVFPLYEKLDEIKSTKSIYETNKQMGIGEFQGKLWNKPALMFIHLPKTGGTTLWHVLNKQFHYTTLQKQLIVPSEVDEFFSKQMNVKCKYDLIGGHFNFGLHTQLEREVNYITLLRDPIERIISEYYYTLSTKEHIYHKYLIENKINFEQFIETGFGDGKDTNWNCMARMLAGNYTEGDTEIDLDMAKQNLKENLLTIGLTEEFDETLQILKWKLGWSIEPFYVKHNVTKSRPKISEIDSTTKEMIAEKNKYDIELYNYAKELFEEEKKEYGDNFVTDVREFQFFNKIYSNVG